MVHGAVLVGALVGVALGRERSSGNAESVRNCAQNSNDIQCTEHNVVAVGHRRVAVAKSIDKWERDAGSTEIGKLDAARLHIVI